MVEVQVQLIYAFNKLNRNRKKWCVSKPMYGQHVIINKPINVYLYILLGPKQIIHI